jgi:hydroxymethyl cephem carbamoyltransferase
MTVVVSVKPGHDGSVAVVAYGRLITSVEAEKDSGHRYADLGVTVALDALAMVPDVPDVLATSGWHRWVDDHSSDVGAGYHGTGRGTFGSCRLLGRTVRTFTSSHERSHLMSAVGLYPRPLSDRFAALVWEGRIGSLYVVEERGLRVWPMPVLDHPGGKYAALMALADPGFPDRMNPRHDYAGKLMALAAYGDASAVEDDDRAVVEQLLGETCLFPFGKGAYWGTHLHDCGIDDPRFRNAAKLLSNRIFEMFSEAAAKLFDEPLPLLISGGCGLNCDWNAAWTQTGVFSDVFVPPCANDSGSAIGTAVDALAHLGEDPQLTWSVDAGQTFIMDEKPSPDRWESLPYRPESLATALARGSVVAWINGRYEMGPRALGRRSLLAVADLPANRDLLNTIKGRESYRPIAPMCREEDFDRYFAGAGDPFMLYFARVVDDRLAAVSHVDGSARVQVVDRRSNQPIHDLLGMVGKAGRLPVLCNTSLNFHGRGFINRMSDLTRYCEQTGVNEMVVDDVHHRRRDRVRQ